MHTYRVTEDLTQIELGKKIGGLSRGIICDYESGCRIPSSEKAFESSTTLTVFILKQIDISEPLFHLGLILLINLQESSIILIPERVVASQCLDDISSKFKPSNL